MIVPGHPVLHRPLDISQCPITQAYGNINGIEPNGYVYPDGSIAYVPGKDATLDHVHNGIDYAAPCGTKLYAPAGGKVLLAGISPSGFGLRLLVRSGPVEWLFGHLSDILVEVGDRVHVMDTVAISGGGNGDARDGNSTGCHLHWSVIRWSDGHYIQPWVGARPERQSLLS